MVSVDQHVSHPTGILVIARAWPERLNHAREILPRHGLIEQQELICMKVTNLYHLVLGSGPRPRLQPRDDRTGERHAVTIVPPVSRLECGTSCVPVCWTGAWGYPLAASSCVVGKRKHRSSGSGIEMLMLPNLSSTCIFTAAEVVENPLNFPRVGLRHLPVIGPRAAQRLPAWFSLPLSSSEPDQSRMGITPSA